MIIIKVLGGLGNQMFQIALYTALEEKGKQVKLDLTELDDYLKKRDWTDVLSVFDISVNKASKQEISSFADNNQSFFNKIRRRVFGRKKTHYFEKEDGIYDENIENMDDVFLEGYWQTELYFNKYKDKIIEKFTFPKIINKDTIKYKDLICQSQNAISLHVRRGDYLQGINNDIFGNICTENYYKKAEEYFKKKYENCTFFIFSNDKQYLDKVKNKKNYIIVNCNDDKDAWMDMYLMTLCKHNIIANSTFSWWGAWLNKNPDQEVVAPLTWLNDRNMRDICPTKWIRM